MIKNIINPKDIEQFKQLISGVNRIAITCHKKADGDAMGSSMGLSRLMSGNTCKKVVVVILLILSVLPRPIAHPSRRGSSC